MPEKPNIDEKLLEIVEKSSPKTVKELLQIAEKELGLPEKELLEHIARLNDKELLDLTSSNVKDSGNSNWLWIVVALSLSDGMAVLLIPENSYPYVYIRNILGLILVTVLPGYSLTRALFPRKQIDTVERMALSIGLSLSLVAITGLILNYTPWGIRPLPIAVSLICLSIILSLIARMREHERENKRNLLDFIGPHSFSN